MDTINNSDTFEKNGRAEQMPSPESELAPSPEQTPVEKGVLGPEADPAKLREQIEKTDIDDTLKLQAQGQADDMRQLQAEEKVKELLNIAKTKGVVYAVHVAKGTKDPFVLDLFHDALAKEGYYKFLAQ